MHDSTTGAVSDARRHIDSIFIGKIIYGHRMVRQDGVERVIKCQIVKMYGPLSIHVEMRFRDYRI